MFILSEWDAIQFAQFVYYVPNRRGVEVWFGTALATAPRRSKSRQEPAGAREHFEAADDSH
jgi:hypothetical protein